MTKQLLRASGRGRSALMLVLILVNAGCGAQWRRMTVVEPAQLSPRQQIQVWTTGRGRATRLHSVVFRPDSVAGVPFTEHPDCDTCRVSYVLAEVDSIRVGHPERGFLKGTGLVLGGIYALTYFLFRKFPGE